MRVAVLGGGRSPEHDVSLRGASAVAEGLRAQGHEVVQVILALDGRWMLDGAPLQLSPGGGLLGVDCVFPVLHGPGGEDGSVQGLLELLDVPYVGSGVLSSALSLDKLAFKDSAKAAGIPQVDYVSLSIDRWAAEPKVVAAEVERLAKPWWVKAACGGSSLGMEPVTEASELAGAIERCLLVDHRVIVEAAATGAEIECAVLGGPPSPTKVSDPGQIVVNTDGGWYDHEAKYTPGGMDLIVPAPLPPEVIDEVRALCLRAYAHAGNHGLARVDCFVDLEKPAGEQVLLNEINTLPGFTATSVYSRLWAASGLGYGELLDELLAVALARPRRLPLS
ncbi:MAG: D-alanine--D-alanine ligase family protein [Solirubrobacteraceae bacterium]|nr:D-alanine--D-alanine ligase family protein [Solirubrobacteraceae bacterium]